MTHTATQLPIISDPTDRDRLNPPLPHQRRHGLLRRPACRRTLSDTLVWLSQPHIQPWRHAIAAAFRDHRESDTQQALSRGFCAMSPASWTSKPTPPSASARRQRHHPLLANAIQRLQPPPPRGEGRGWGLANRRDAANTNTPLPLRRGRGRGVGSRSTNRTSEILTPISRAAKELHHAKERVLDELSRLSINLERRAENKNELEDANAPLGTVPSWARSDPLPPPSRSGQSRAGVGLANIPSEPLSSEPPPPAHHSIENRKSKIENPITRGGDSEPPPRSSSTEHRKSKKRKPPHPLPRLPHPPSPQAPPPPPQAPRPLISSRGVTRTPASRVFS